MSTRLFLTLHNRLYRELLIYRLLEEQDMHLAGEAQTGMDTLSALRTSHADLLIIEEDLPDTDGLTIAEMALLQDPLLNIILLAEGNVRRQREAIYLEAGIKCVISLEQPLPVLFQAIGYVSRGQVFVSAENEHRSFRRKCQQQCMALSDREQEVAWRLSQRQEAKRIADQMGISYKTVHSYKDRIFIKLGVSTLPELILFMNRAQKDDRP